MSDLSFEYLASVTANTKRATMADGHQPNLFGLKCLPLAPVDPETRKRLDLNTPHVVFETFFEGAPDIRKSDLLVIDDIEYPVRSVAPWPWPGTTRLHVIVEDLRN